MKSRIHIFPTFWSTGSCPRVDRSGKVCSWKTAISGGRIASLWFSFLVVLPNTVAIAVKNHSIMIAENGSKLDKQL